MKLHYFKDISHKEGYDYFLDQLKTNYPETNLGQKYLIVYRWDSIMYDGVYRDQMKVLDSIATRYQKDKFECFFVTEMDEKASTAFLRKNFDEYKNVKLLYRMDDFISGLYSLKDINIVKLEYVHGQLTKERNNDNLEDVRRLKRTSFYLIMDPKGRVIYTNGDRYMILKDSVFLNKVGIGFEQGFSDF